MISPYLAWLRAHVGSQPLIVPSVSAAVFDGTRVLAGFHATARRWMIPGGAIDPGETPAQAAIRETREETGLEIEVDRLVGVWGGTPELHVVYSNGDVVDYVMSAFAGRVVAGDLAPDREEFSELGWFTIAELQDLPVAAWMPEVIDALADPGQSFRRPH